MPACLDKILRLGGRLLRSHSHVRLCGTPTAQGIADVAILCVMGRVVALRERWHCVFLGETHHTTHGSFLHMDSRRSHTNHFQGVCRVLLQWVCEGGGGMNNLLVVYCENKNLREKYSEKSFVKAKEFDSKKIEQREAEIYSELIGVKNN